MKVKANLVISKGYSTAIIASQWIGECLKHCEEYNEEYYGEQYRSQPRERATVTVIFDVPDSVFEREPIPELQATLQPITESDLVNSAL